MKKTESPNQVKPLTNTTAAFNFSAVPVSSICTSFEQPVQISKSVIFSKLTAPPVKKK